MTIFKASEHSVISSSCPGALLSKTLFRCVLECLWKGLSIRQSVRPSVGLSVRPSIRPSICRSVFPSSRPSVCLSVGPSVRNAFFFFYAKTCVFVLWDLCRRGEGRVGRGRGWRGHEGVEGGGGDDEGRRSHRSGVWYDQTYLMPPYRTANRLNPWQSKWRRFVWQWSECWCWPSLPRDPSFPVSTTFFNICSKIFVTEMKFTEKMISKMCDVGPTCFWRNFRII